MIISRTPFRISFFGGGTDYPTWYKENGGSVLGTTINRYCYITCRYLPPFFNHKSRIIYSRMEHVKKTSDINHPSVKACLQFMDIKKGVEIHHDGDLPARTGLGSSSSFTVGLLHSLYTLKHVMPTKRQLAENTIHLEQDVMKEHVGSQDQVLTAFGGFNLITFGGPALFDVQPVILDPKRLKEFQKHMMLFFTGFSRSASQVAKEQIKRIPSKKNELKKMHGMVDNALSILTSTTDITEFGRLLNEYWYIKRSLSNKITTPFIDDIYTSAIDAGALGGKILGAGGGGFMLVFAKPESQSKIKNRLKKLLHVPFRFESLGSQIVFHSI